MEVGKKRSQGHLLVVPTAPEPSPMLQSAFTVRISPAQILPWMHALAKKIASGLGQTARNYLVRKRLSFCFVSQCT